MVDLNTLIPAGSSLQLVRAKAINDSGEIAGEGVPPGCAVQDLDSCGHAFVLIPCDDDGCGDSTATMTQSAPAPLTDGPSTAKPWLTSAAKPGCASSAIEQCLGITT